MAACCGARIAWILRVLLVILILACFGTCDMRKGLRQHLERFFCSVDQDGDGEIEQHEASKFLNSFREKLDFGEDSKDDNGGCKDVMLDFIPLHNFKGDFSYGGATISVEEMLDHLQNMLTADRVVDWITHGLQLPQYAQAFRENAVNGLDFPALIEDHSQTLLYELQVQSLLHRKKITHAIVRQVFGYGAVPSPPQNLMCVSASCAVQVQWEAPSFLGYPPLHKYLLQKRLDNASSWKSIGDSKENNFLDRDGVYQGKVYTYRVQAWGDHGPSEWVQIHGCRSSDAPVSDKHCDMETLINTAEITPQIEAFSGARGISSVDLHGMEVVTESSEGWGWMYPVNFILLILGIISRQSLFFRLVLASWILFRDKLLVPIYTELIQAQDSKYILPRMIGHAFLSLFSLCLFMQAKIWDLSRQVNGDYPETFSVNPGLMYRKEYMKEIESINDINEISGTEWAMEDTNIRHSHEDEYFRSKFPSEKHSHNVRLNSEMMQMQYAKTSPQHQNHNIGGSVNSLFLDTETRVTGEIETLHDKHSDAQGEYMKSTKHFMAVGTTSGGRHSNLSGSVSKDFKKHTFSIPNERVDKCNEISLKTMSLSYHRKTDLTKILSRKRNRCNYEGCKSRFDRWHSLSDWQMRFSKHYCRDCQGVFCVKHTRISPHGPFGQCGLDSSCVCQACFEQLPLEAKEILEQINKLRVGPYASDDSFSHEKKRKWLSLKNVSSHTKVKLKLSGKNGMDEAQNEYNSQHTRGDPYPPNLDLAYYSDSADSSISNLSQISSVSSSHSHKVDSRST